MDVLKHRKERVFRDVPCYLPDAVPPAVQKPYDRNSPHTVCFHEIRVFIKIYEDRNKVCLQIGAYLRLDQNLVQFSAVGSPIRAEVEKNFLFRRLCLLYTGVIGMPTDFGQGVHRLLGSAGQ